MGLLKGSKVRPERTEVAVKLRHVIKVWRNAGHTLNEDQLKVSFLLEAVVTPTCLFDEAASDLLIKG